MHAIEFENVSFAYDPSAPLLNNITFQIEKGQSVALLGCNGSGKSTIVKLANLLLLPQHGRISINGTELLPTTNTYALHQTIGYVMQDPNDQLVATIVEDEVAFGPANLGLNTQEIHERVTEALTMVGMQESRHADVNTLSGGEKQRIAIAGALAMHPEILILDEATAMLDPAASSQVMDTIERITANNVTVLFTTHDLHEAHRADRIICIDEGRIASSIPSLIQQSNERIRTFKKTTAPDASAGHTPIIEFKEVSFTYDTSEKEPHAWALRNINTTIEKGSVVSIMGANGSGKSTFIQHMNGLLHPTLGSVKIDGVDIANKEYANVARRKVGVCFQFPERQLFAATVFDDIAFGPRNLGCDEHEVCERVKEACAQLRIDIARIASRSPFTLSGGQARRVALAGVLAMRPEILVLDEPCAGLDIPTHLTLLELLDELADGERTLVMVTHDQHDAHVLSDRIIHMEAGTIAA